MLPYKVYPYVYKLTHRKTKHFYIGYREANVLPAIEDIVDYKSSSKKVHDLGFENFDIEIIAEFFQGTDAYDFENFLIETHINDDLCLNGHYTKNGNLQYRRVGPHTENTKNLMSKAKIGKQFTDEHIEKLRVSHLGKKQSPEVIEKRMVSKRGKPLSAKHRQNISNSLLGHEVSQETKEKLILANTGKKQSAETIEKRINKIKGKKVHSIEFRQRQSELMKERQRKKKEEKRRKAKNSST